MTVPSQTSKSGPYNGNGVTKAFDYDFRIVSAGHLTVILADSAVGSERLLINGVDYGVSGVGNDNGGQITLAVAPLEGQTITILRNVPFTQETDLENQGAYYAETVEAALDLAAMRDQQLQEQVSRAVTIPAWEDPAQLDGLVSDILRLADSADNLDLVAHNMPDVLVVASNIGAVSAVAGNVANINAVAENAANINSAVASAATIHSVAGQVEDDAAAARADRLLAEGAAADADERATDAAAARDAAVAARNVTTDARDVAIVARDEGVIACEAAIVARNEAEAFRNQAAQIVDFDITDYATKAEVEADYASKSALDGKADKNQLVGKQTISVPAAAIYADREYPAIPETQSGVSGVVFKSMNFAQLVGTRAQFSVAMPKSWDGGNLTAQFYWFAGGVGDVVWAARALAAGDGDLLNAEFGAIAHVIDGSAVGGTLNVSSETGPIAVSGNAAGGDVLFFQILRRGAEVADTLRTDAKLLAVKILYTTNAPTDD